MSYINSLHTYRHHASLRWHEGRSVAESQLSLQSVEADLQLAFLLDLKTGREVGSVSEQIQQRTLRCLTS